MAGRHVDVRERREALRLVPDDQAWPHAVRDLTVKVPANPGDYAQSILVKSANGTVNTVPVTIRSLAKVGATFHGVLTGGNGRGNPAVQSTYAFNVPAGQTDIEAGVVFNDVNDGVVAFLQDPQGNNVAQSSNLFQSSTPSNTVTVYKDHPEAGTWTLVLDWLQPVSGTAINTPFVGKVTFNKVKVTSNLPDSSTTIPQGSPGNFTVNYTNTSPAPQFIFLDPRQSTSDWLFLPDLFGNPEPFPVLTPCVAPGVCPSTVLAFMVPQDTTQLFAGVDSTAPVDVRPLLRGRETRTCSPRAARVRRTCTRRPAGKLRPDSGAWPRARSVRSPHRAATRTRRPTPALRR